MHVSEMNPTDGFEHSSTKMFAVRLVHLHVSYLSYSSFATYRIIGPISIQQCNAKRHPNATQSGVKIIFLFFPPIHPIFTSPLLT